MRRRLSVILLLVVLSLAAPAVLGGVQEDGETLLPGQARERTIAGGEKHVYRVQVADTPLLITVEQKGINLVVERQESAARFLTDSGLLHWGPEVLLLESAGERRIEVRPREPSVGSGRYTIQVEELQASAESRRAALSLMSRAGQEAAEQTPEARHRAMATYREALAAWRALGERRWQADSLDAIAMVEAEERELRPAAEDYSRALALWRELADPHREAATLNELGLTRLYTGETKAAREALQSALALWQRLGERFDEGLTRSNLCSVDHINGALPAALSCYEETRALFRELGDKSQEARLLNSIGGVYDLQGEPDAALKHYEQALPLCRTIADPRFEAQTLNNIAVVHLTLGEWQEALRVYGQVREILPRLGDRLQEGALLRNIGSAYNSLGEPQRARSFLEASLKLRRETGDRRGEVNTLNSLGSVWRALGDAEKALAYHRQALDRAGSLGDRQLEAVSRLRLGEVQLERRDAAAALRELAPALDYFHTTGNRRNEVQFLDLRGRALHLAGQPQEALPVLQTALALHRTLHDRAGEAEALRTLAATERSLGQLVEARAHADEAVAAVEELRTGFVSPDLRAAFMATQRRAYALVIDLLMDRYAAEPKGGHDRAAFEVSEQARARSLLDILQSGRIGRPGGAVPAELLQRRQALRRRLSSMAYQQLQQTGAKAEALGRETEALRAELDGVEADFRRLDPLYAAVSNPPKLGVEEIAKLLDADTLLLEYSLGEDRSYLWEVGAGSFRSFVLPAQRDIEAPARQLYEELSTLEAGTRRRTKAAEKLSQILLGPVWSDVAHCRRLVVVPDAALQVLPFGALPVPGSGKPLVEQLEIEYLPSATTLAQQRQRLDGRAPASQLAAVIADPVFKPDDPRVARPAGARRPSAGRSKTERGAPEGAPLSDLERLPATQREAKEIATLAPGPVWIAIGLEANREAVLSGRLRDYRFIHFATHAVADSRNPELSGLVLSLVDAARRQREGFLGLSDIYDLDLGADLVVLSGCRTALGKEVRGEGIMGLTRGFLYAGVPRVVASLWKVQDRTTAELMSRFYRALWRDHLPPAAALRKAQRSLRREPRYRDPYSWAGFVLQGDWR